MKRYVSSGILTFGLIGVLGFAIDGGLLTLLYSWAGRNIYLSRLVSFTVATATTWYLNRTLTFGTSRGAGGGASRQYLRYVLVQVGGGLVNLAIFVASIHLFESLRNIPIVPLGLGAVFGMLFNYGLSRTYVFGGAHG
ncbi:MAG TPA: GtrA family protein [Rhodocyclaceae bacterium]|nr:GtrA family protein [Rhodocyclaceae bacterium]